MDVGQTFCGYHFAIIKNIESLCYKPDTNVNYVSIKMEIQVK